MSSMWTAQSDFDYYGDDGYPPDEPEPEPELITEAEMLEAMAEDAGDRAYDAAEEYRLCPETIGPFPAPVVRIERAYLPPLQGELFSKEVA